jgi:hypothetical protein
MPRKYYVRVSNFWINSCGRVVAEREKESAFTTFFETQRNMQYYMMLKPVMKHNTSYVLITPEGVSNYGRKLPIFMEEVIRI